MDISRSGQGNLNISSLNKWDPNQLKKIGDEDNKMQWCMLLPHPHKYLGNDNISQI